MLKWKNAGDTLGKYRCVTLITVTKKFGVFREKCLSGRRGEIWEQGEGTYKALVFLSSKQEKIYTFNSKQLGSWITRLEVPSDPDQQAIFANGFGKAVV